MDLKKLGNRIKEQRERRKLRQADIAGALGISTQAVSKWERGENAPDIALLVEVEGVPVKYVGDGFLGFVTGANCCQRAIDAALSAKKRLATPDFITVVNYGDIYLGTIGHPDYSMPDILGETVNTAFLVMSWVAANLKTGIGITDSAKNNLQQDTGLAECGRVSVAGRTAPVIIYEWSD